MKRILTLSALLGLMAWACAGATSSPNDSLAVGADTTASPTTVADDVISDSTQPDRTASTLPEQLPPEENPLPDRPVDTSAVPASLMDQILADAATRSGMSASDIYAVRAEAALWNDGSLGCPKPDMSYTQAQVDGYWVVLQAGDTLLDYRATQSGFFTFCDNPFPKSSGAPSG